MRLIDNLFPHRKVFCAWIGMMLLAACVALEAPKSFNDRLAYGYASVAASAETAASMVERGRLTKEQGKQALSLVDQATAALDLSRAASGRGDIGTAEGQLSLALTVLTRLEAYLKENQ